MGERKIKSVETNKNKGKTYSALINKYNDAIASGFYGEAELIVYAFLEDRLRSFIYYSNLIDTWNSNILNEKGVSMIGTDANINNISVKIRLIKAAIKNSSKSVYEQTDFEKTLKKTYNYAINRVEFKATLNKIEKWCDYRNEVVHAMFNKDIKALREGYCEHVMEGFDLARYIDTQVRRLKNT